MSDPVETSEELEDWELLLDNPSRYTWRTEG